MLTDCDLLSRYNRVAEEWRRRQTPTPKVKVSVPTGQVQLFSNKEMQCNRQVEAFATLPPVSFVGNKEAETITAAANSCDRPTRRVIAQDMFATALSEAMEEMKLGRPTMLEDEPIEHMEAMQATQTSAFLNVTAQSDKPEADWYLASFPGPYLPEPKADGKLKQWLFQQINRVFELVGMCQIQAAVIFAPYRMPDGTKQLLQRAPALPDGWKLISRRIRNTAVGGDIDTDHVVLMLTPEEICQRLTTRTWPSSSDETGEMAHCLDVDVGWTPDALVLDDMDVRNPTMVQRHHYGESNDTPQIAKFVRPVTATKPIDGYPIFSTRRPAPSIYRERPEETFFEGFFGIWHQPAHSEPYCRPIRVHEVFNLLGVKSERMHQWEAVEQAHILARARVAPGIQAITTVLQALVKAELDFQGCYGYVPLLIADPTPAVVIPLPNEQTWIDATNRDPSLREVIQALTTGEQPCLQRITEKGYLAPLRNNQLEHAGGCLYYYERNLATRTRQLRTRVVPPDLRRVVVAACHSSPFGGHSGITRTLSRVQARFWWPGMTRDIHQGVRGCGHCNLSNAASHETQAVLHTLTCDAPFDVVFLDFWTPGDSVMDKHGNVKIITYLDCMTGFAMATALRLKDVETANVAMAVTAAFFTSVGLPRLIIVDADGMFAGTFKNLFELLRIPVDPVSRENHKAVRNERFHRYLNKVQRINTAETDSFFRWFQGVLFSLYAWNAGPIDGTDIPRSYAAMGRDFPFPIDLSAQPRAAAAEGQQAADHFEAASPLLFQQRKLLNVLNAERRQRHIELRNESVTERTFAPGDLVIVRKQVKSNAAKGISAKLVFKTKGPYRVIERMTPSSYKIQKLPFLRGLGRPGRFLKENAARMTKLPSTMVIHKKADGTDTRLSLLSGPFSEHPLEKWLGVVQCGGYKKADGDPAWAFERLENMWSDPVDDDDSSVDEIIETPNDNDMPRVDAADSSDDEVATTEVAPANQHTTAADPQQAADLSDSDRRALKKFYHKIRNSGDRIVIVRRQPDPNTPASFEVGQVVWNDVDTQEARQLGRYPVRWYMPSEIDRQERSTMESRFWPKFQTIRADGQPGEIYPVKPHKADEVHRTDSTRKWLQDRIDLAENILVGPFDFCKIRIPMQGAKRKAIHESHRIDRIYWQILEQNGPRNDVDVSRIRLKPNE